MERIIEHGVPLWQREVEMYMRNFSRFNDPQDIQNCLNYLTDNVLRKTYSAGYTTGASDCFEDLKETIQDQTGVKPAFLIQGSALGAERSYNKWEGLP